MSDDHRRALVEVGGDPPDDSGVLTVLRTGELVVVDDMQTDSLVPEQVREVAVALGLSSATLHYHLRRAHRQLLATFFDDAST